MCFYLILFSFRVSTVVRELIGDSGTKLYWFESHLRNRDVISMGNFSLELRKIKYGIPQGSVLGPFIFIVYVLPLAHITSNKIS